MMEVWFKLKCPYCATINWLCGGSWDIVDSSETDVEACTCFNCNGSWPLYKDEDDNDFPEAFAELGEQDPR